MPEGFNFQARPKTHKVAGEPPDYSDPCGGDKQPQIETDLSDPIELIDHHEEDREGAEHIPGSPEPLPSIDGKGCAGQGYEEVERQKYANGCKGDPKVSARHPLQDPPA